MVYTTTNAIIIADETLIARIADYTGGLDFCVGDVKQLLGVSWTTASKYVDALVRAGHAGRIMLQTAHVIGIHGVQRGVTRYYRILAKSAKKAPKTVTDALYDVFGYGAFTLDYAKHRVPCLQEVAPETVSRIIRDLAAHGVVERIQTGEAVMSYQGTRVLVAGKAKVYRVTIPKRDASPEVDIYVPTI